MKQYIADAFTDKVFSGNPAAVCVMESWLPDELMKKIAAENNLSETAFIVRENETYHIRWFTPGKEVDLCGHATLASAFVLANFYDSSAEAFDFTSLSGKLRVRKNGSLFEMNFPSRMPLSVSLTADMCAPFTQQPAAAFLSRDLMLVFEKEQDIISYQPDFQSIASIPDGMGLIITAPSEKYDFVSRAFFPKIKVNEDPVCGSAHCNLIPYWAKRLGKKTLIGHQVSPRGGIVYCEDAGDRVLMSGKAALFSECEIHI